MHPRVIGYEGSDYEKFKSLQGACEGMIKKGIKDFDLPVANAAERKPMVMGRGKYYAVASGKNTDIFTDWSKVFFLHSLRACLLCTSKHHLRTLQKDPNTEIDCLNNMELLPSEIIFGIVKYLDNREVKQLSRSSRRMRDVCLPSLFRKLSVKFSNKGLSLLESILKSNLDRYILSFESVALMILKPSKGP